MGRGGAPSPNAPRLSAFLRVAVGGEAYDVDAACVERSTLLRTARDAPRASPLAVRLFGSRGVAGASREARAAHAKLLAAVQALLGDAVAPQELACAALVAYDALLACGGAPREAVAALRSSPLALAVSETGAERARAAALALHATLCLPAGEGGAGGGSVGEGGERGEPSGTVPEFGCDLPFSPPRADGRLCAEAAWEAAPRQPAAPPVEGSTSSPADSVLLSFRSHCLAVASTGALDCAHWEEVARVLASSLLSSRSGEEAAAELFDLFGHACLDALAALLADRTRIAQALRPRLAALKASLSGGDGCGASGSQAAPQQPSYAASQVSVTSLADREADRARRKDGRRAAKRAATGCGDPLLEWLSSQGVPFGALLEADGGAWAAPTPPPEDQLLLGFGSGDAALRAALPAGTTRSVHPIYEVVTVPPPSPQPSGSAAPPLFPISDLAPWERTAFAGYTHLNRIQSSIEPAARRGAANLLVCAPTGAGKTNIAMLAVLRELALRRWGGTGRGGEGPAGPGGEGGDDGGRAAAGARFDTTNFKVVYVAPMKALAAEVAAAFGRRLEPLGVRVRELTGDIQLTRRELAETHMLVTTPEKWDVVTRKGGEGSAAAAAALLILDEVHLLAEERGAVLEALVARTRRQVEAQQRPIRLLGLSATLPNPGDVAAFLGVPPSGLFVFDASFRPVPLTQRFVGVTESNPGKRLALMNVLAYREAVSAVRRGKQAMVFVHSRADTGRTARALADMAAVAGEADLFDTSEHPEADLLARDVQRSRNRELLELAPKGFGVHHAGMLRPDRSLSERLFSRGAMKVLVCTATLAWGVNLPAHTVVIKGTQVYDAARGGYKDLGCLDVAQIFGRAGRPQFDDSGEGVILTQHSRLAHYLAMLTAAVPIESHFVKALRDNLNAECVLGTVTDVAEGAAWLAHSFFHVRARRNPLAYGLTWAELASDPALQLHSAKLVREAARALDAARMLRLDERTGQLYTTDSGRVAAHFYLRCASMEVYNEALKPHMSLADMFAMVSRSAEFENLAPREEEMAELEALASSSACPVDIRAGLATKEGKANVLIQAYISRSRMEAFSLVADSNYIAASVVRICRALAELVLRRGWPGLAAAMLTLAKAAERRLWPQQHPLRQFEALPSAASMRGERGLGAQGGIPLDVLRRLEDKGEAGALERLADMNASELAALSRSNPQIGQRLASAVAAFPWLELSASVQPLTRTVLRVSLHLRAPFQWRDGAHGGSLRWQVWVEDQSHEHIYHSELFSLTKRAHAACGGGHTEFTIPVFEPMPPQYYVRCVSESWLGSEATLELSLRDVVLPGRHPAHTELLPLRPLPRSALGNAAYEQLYQDRFTHFNAIQTQAFHTLYHTDHSVLLGAPTGSGKTVSAELAILRAFTVHPGRTVVYIAPLKALVRERVSDWKQGLCAQLGKRLVELTGDAPADGRALLAADLIVCTPEKWDAVSRSWNARAYVQRVCSLIIDEIHLLGADRGPVLEIVISRMRYIAAATGSALRVVGLSTALANAGDVAAWLSIPPVGLFNFKPAVRPVPLEVHIQGHAGAAYCPRMAAMNKPTYAAIKAHAHDAPALVFVASRRQTRLTALELLALAAADDAPPRFLGASAAEAASWASRVRDPSLAHALAHGVGMHHAGLHDSDRSLVEQLFLTSSIRVLVATATLAWGVNLPAHLVVIKGTEYFDGASKRYVDFPITDVLQMMGRAGRPQFDTSGVAVILVHEPKKAFYKKFLYEPFPVESALPGALTDHLNAEVAGGTVRSRQDAVDFVSWSYLFRRVSVNPSYYGLPSSQAEHVDAYLSGLVAASLKALQASGCVVVDEDAEGYDDDSRAASIWEEDPFEEEGVSKGWRGAETARPRAGGGAARGGCVRGTALGAVAARYYLRHATAATLGAFSASGAPSTRRMLRALASAAEFDELPVRHNEEHSNAALAASVAAAAGWPTNTGALEDPHTKAHLLLQAHLLRLPMPVSDYTTDLKGVLDNAMRIILAAVDIALQTGRLVAATAAMHVAQAIAQARHPAALAVSGSAILLPKLSAPVAKRLAGAGLCELRSVAELAQRERGAALAALRRAGLDGRDCDDALQVAARLPLAALAATVGVAASGDTSLAVRVTRLGGDAAGKPYAPGLARPTSDGWWLMALDSRSEQLHAARRVSLGRSAGAVTAVSLRVPADAAAPGSNLQLRLVSDTYVGLDVQLQLAEGESEQPKAEAAAPKDDSEDEDPAVLDEDLQGELACAGADGGEWGDPEQAASREWDAAQGTL